MDDIHLSHTPHCFEGGAAYVYESPLGDSCLAMNIYNPFMHCVTSQYAFKPRDVMLLNNRISIATITYATSSPCRVPPFKWHVSPRFNNATDEIANLRQISNFLVSTALGKHHLNSVWTKYVCDKSENARVCSRYKNGYMF